MNPDSALSAAHELAAVKWFGTASSVAGPTSYDIKIVSISGAVVKTAISSSTNWQTNLANLSPGTYIIQVVNQKDNSLVGKSTFVKM